MPYPQSASSCQAGRSLKRRTLRHFVGRIVGRSRRLGVAPVALTTTLILGCCVAGAHAGEDATAEVAIAAHGFGRPERIAAFEGVYGSQVAVAAAPNGPVALWQDSGGLSSRELPEGSDQRFVSSRGVRAVWAGQAGGDPVVVWEERDLRTGRMRLLARWRNDTRTVLERAQAPLVAVISGGDEPELLSAGATRNGWVFELHRWDGSTRRSDGRPLTVAGIDAQRQGDAVLVAWLEGSNERIFGRTTGSWSAYLARWEAGQPTPDPPVRLGAARYERASDVVRIGGAAGSEVAWPAADGTLRLVRDGAAPQQLGRGILVGQLGGRWTWIEERLVRQSDPSGEPRTVSRLPAAPEHVAAAHAAGVTAIVWSSGRYQGGLEVWSVTDADPYRDSPLERFALMMGWDPWRPFLAAAGQLLIALLAGVLLASALTPVWWLAALALSRHGTASPRRVALDGALLGVVAPTLAAFATALRIEAIGGPGAQLLVGSGWLLAGVSGGFVAALLLLRGRDLDGTLGRLLAAWIAGFTLLTILAFGTLGAWQRALGTIV